MQSRDMKKEEFFANANQLVFSEKEEKELKQIMLQIGQIDFLRRQTCQKRNDYNYYKKIMLPSDYRKIRADLKEQVDFKVARETYKLETQLKEKGETQENIDKETQQLKEEIYKHYKIRLKGIKTSLEEEATMDYIDQM